MDDRSVLAAFGRNARKLRIKAGLSQEQLADIAHLHRTYVGSVERGERNISLVNIYRLAEALGVSPTQLLPDDEE
ncbi:helix-turn-helix domain-containing protein [Streptomyces sp. NPDC003522]